MPTKTIKIHVHTNNDRNGVLSVKVTPWRVHLDAADNAVWELDTSGPSKNDVAWFRVEQIDQEHPWPFNGNPPPDPAYTGMASGSGKVTTPPRNTANSPDDVIRYGLTIGFTDDTGRLRLMYIDPDMVIDT